MLNALRFISTTLALACIATPALATTQWSPFSLRQMSGTRPFVDVRINNVPFSFMVHANAGFYAMTTHANAQKANVGALDSTGHYGITSRGKVSNQGVAYATAKTLEVGSDVVQDAPLKVFEVPQSDLDGMLGVGWLRARQVIMDFDQHRLGIPSSHADTEQERKQLLGAGYIAHPMAWDKATNQYSVQAQLNGVTATFVVSTVAALVIDDKDASRTGIKFGDAGDAYGGPSGTTGKVYTAAGPLSLSIDGQPLSIPSHSEIYDIYAYTAKPRPEQPAQQLGGYLGADVMLTNHAVIDFGDGVLYLKR
jgi:predicted aspartyl protease